MAAVFMVAAGWYGYVDGEAVNFGTLFTFYSLSVAFYMPTLALTNSVAYTALDKSKTGPCHRFSSHPYFRNDWFHLLHVADGYLGIPK